MSVLLLALPLFACKKKDPEPAPEAAVEEEPAPPPANPAHSVLVNVSTDAEQLKSVCKDTGTTQTVDLVDGSATLTMVDGEQCKMVVLPAGADWMNLSGGTTLNCLVDDTNSVQCKGG